MSTVPPQPPSPAQPVPIPPAAMPPKPDLTMAWLAHLLMLFTCFIGPLVIWLTKKDQDKYAAFHAKQATFLVVALAVVVIFLWLMTVAMAFVAGPLAMVGGCFMWVIIIGFYVYAIIGIVFTAQGKPFKYFFIADKFCAKEFAEAYPEVAAQQPAPPA